MAKPYKTIQQVKYSSLDGLSRPHSKTRDYTGKTAAEIHQALFNKNNVLSYITFDISVALVDGKEQNAPVENLSPMTYFGEIVSLDDLVPSKASAATSKTLTKAFQRSAPYVAEQKAKGITHAVLLSSGHAVPLTADSRVFNKENRQVWPIGEKPVIRAKPQM